MNGAAEAIGRAFFELLEEEQRAAQARMTQRRDAIPSAIDELVDRVFFRLGRRSMDILSRTPEAAKPLTPETACKPAGGGTDG